MFTIKQPSTIIFGKYSAHVYEYPKNSLVITSSGAKKRNWLEYLQLKNHYIFDQVKPNPSIDITTSIINEFKKTNFTTVIGIGGGSCLDVAKFVATKLNKKKTLMLHAYKINFSIAETKYNFSAEPPLEFKNFLKEKYLKIY